MPTQQGSSAVALARAHAEARRHHDWEMAPYRSPRRASARTPGAFFTLALGALVVITATARLRRM
jgi:hypothetical protein